MKNKFILLFSLVFISFQSLQSATFIVTSTSDANVSGTLRYAIGQVNVNPMDADSIKFNIPTSDPNYNLTTGEYTITLSSLLPMILSVSVTIDATTQPNTNLNGPAICIKSNSNLSYAFCFPTSGGTVKGMMIQGFYAGIIVAKSGIYPAGSFTLSNCYIGVNYDGSIAAANEMGIVICKGANNNTIKNNIISGNTTAGIAFGLTNTNTIQGNKIGTDRTGMYRIPNYYGIAIDTSSSNTIGGNTPAQRNIISGNYIGIAINHTTSNSNTIKGNYIGINANGISSTDTISNYDGIAIQNSYGNIIGGTSAAERNIISGNMDAGIAIKGTPSKNNVIKGNYIGLNIAGSDSIPNYNGILMSGANNNTIGGTGFFERNVISGNRQAGIAMAYSGTRNNIIKGNYIGTDRHGMVAISNQTGVYINSNANSNIVGGSTAAERNLISGNLEMGICMEASDSNIVKGNYIGPDSTGLDAFYRPGGDSLLQGNGLYFNSTAKYNIAGGNNAGEGNVISGNRVYGLIYYGNAPYNSCIGNYIGVDRTGNKALPNTTGICVDGGANHNPILNNVLSGNIAYGIFIVTTGTYYNELKGNKIGTNAVGTDTVPNQIGVILGGGTKYNTIGGPNPADRNIISGNRMDGIEVADIGTMYNNIIGNYIGTNAAGTDSLPNYIGVGFATNPSQNNIENNLISGNKYIGLILYENCDSNTVYSNKIGTQANGTSALGNGGAGIVIGKASQYNIIGAPGKGNIIAFNDTIGIGINDTNTIYNTLSSNTIFNNGAMGIDIFPWGVNPNDVGDIDLGANERMNYPIITSVIFDPDNSHTWIEGTIDYTINGGPAGIIIEIFKSDNLNQFQHGDAIEYMGSTTVDGSGHWYFNCTGLTTSDIITATATDLKHNTSEFSLNSQIILGVKDLSNTNSSGNLKIYPNPAKKLLNIDYYSDENSNTDIKFYEITGVEVASFLNKTVSKGYNKLSIDFSNYNLPSGIYFLKFFINNTLEATKKIIISK